MDIYSILAEPNRRQLLDSLLAGEKPVSELVDALGMSQPVVSKHLRIMRDAGVVISQPDGQKRLYRINPEPLQDLAKWLAPYEKFWTDKLDALERHLDSASNTKNRSKS